YSCLFVFHCCAVLGYRHSFPTRRSSDLGLFIAALAPAIVQALGARYAAGDTDSLLMRTAVWLVGRDGELGIGYGPILASMGWLLDRKSTRLNSSHVKISYAVFCLKKKTE